MASGADVGAGHPSSAPATGGAQFQYVHSCDLDSNVAVKICTLEGSIARSNYEQLLDDPTLKFSGRNASKYPDLLVEACIVSDGTRCHVPIFTSYKHFTRRWEWNQWLKLPLKYSDLPRNANLCLEVYDCRGPGNRCCVGATTLNLFGKKTGEFRQGQIDLRVWSDTKADGRTNTTSPGEAKVSGQENVERLTNLTKLHRAGKLPSVDWLDRLSFAEVERISQREKQSSNLQFLMVEFQQFVRHGVPSSVVYFEENGHVSNRMGFKSDIIRCPDFDIEQDNIVEAKHHRLARSQRAGQLDKDLKPNAETRNRLVDIVSYPTTQTLTSEEQDLIWKFRYYLSSNKKALTKFVKCITWQSEQEASQALDLINNRWSPMDVEDALELLGPSFKHPGLRQYAVNRLREATDCDLQLYLLQLVQALKYERMSHDSWAKEGDFPSGAGEANFIGTLQQAEDSSSPPPPVMRIESNASDNSAAMSAPMSPTSTESEPLSPKLKLLADVEGVGGGLAAFLITRACNNSSIANYFYWYLVIECEDVPEDVLEVQRVQKMYKVILGKFVGTLRCGPREWRERCSFLHKQHIFIDRLVKVMRAVQRESGTREKKIERLQALLSNGGSGGGGVGGGRGGAGSPSSGSSGSNSGGDSDKFNFVRFDHPLHLPLDPEIKVCGIIPSEATLFKSSLMPAKLTFITSDGGNYETMFKHGDDLRQDQLILQIITLMDRILQQENLDLKLTPYRVLATSSKHGFMQYVNSLAIAVILKKEGTLQNYLRKYNPSETGPYGIKPEVMDNYVKSCAGYCVITYLLGVGDRHLDNLLLTKSGHLFHIDFGYILGRDPKVMPPPMKLSKEMIQAFGGINSEHYVEFKKECYTAFLSLRRYANLILNLFSLMVDASVPDIALEPDKTVQKVQDKFMLHLNDEEAVRFMQNVIDVSATAVMADIVEMFHKFAQFMRN
jgi:phosphatidylinositol 3-kinase